ncbi:MULTISPECIES: TonB-dependent receptor [unclassified Novosphingobium]|uniref:TonB-dependent receptor n=1 Tax=unclassified Novosphingobium TaxID=2644732 RepID=UPI00181CE16C|nr:MULTISPECIES: TonB-dependent receptor [unclassified Novosphingobium]MBB3357028.1 outer membrane receptor protein involved in Fe transport [Novosphingobium sp. BK256]MBB3373429.1 outer membrane receptor protein involved in Fe transport [Novosphingobium sp. BK280]MBB3377798.1 outer membrane receptor protein involved in Fe transport [Novosphingobium sp. BK258]MBB3418791.1 outer membrane receptor protein involved in Fe transport [Novosphingobium sp. BK267]MBB3450374.1 outer membrane receptor pr
MVRMRSRSRFRCALIAAVAVGTLAPTAVALAQEQRRVEYKIEAGDLGEALKTVSRQSGKEIIFTSEAVLGHKAPALQGIFAADEAVQALLHGSDLVAQFRKDVIIIRGRSTPPGDLADRSAENAEITVTGSRIRGGDIASPRIVSGREAILDAGSNDLGSFARTLPQNYSGGQNPGVAGGGNQGGQQNLTASSTLNLRGLGPDATLTLINGHRVAYDGLAQGVDISAIPLAAIERMEIVTDGSSALYGSDAVGGVANIILRRDFEGLTTSARFGASTDGGNEQQEYNAVTGRRWASGGLMAAADYSRTTGITARQRSYGASLDDSSTFLPRQKQLSLLIAGHQTLSDAVQFSLDGQFADRRSDMSYPSLATTSVTANGLVTHPSVRSYSVTPSLQVELPGRWRATLSGTHAASNTDIKSRYYALGQESYSTRLKYDNSLDNVEAGFEGPLFTLPAGEARLALGGGYRNLGLDINVVQTANAASSTIANSSNSRQVAFAYGEVSVPLVGPGNSRPFLHRLLLNGAVRYEHYNAIGSVATPKFGLVYSPAPDLTLKGSWGRSFKAPTLNQQFQVREGLLAPGYYFVSYPAGQDVLYLSGGNPDLKAERAETWSVTAEFEPEFAKGLKLQASYFNIRFKDRVVVPFTSSSRVFTDPSNADSIILDPTTDQIAHAVSTLPLGVENATGAPYDPSLVSAIVDGSLRNAAVQSIRGVDMALAYRLAFGSGEAITFNASASYLESEQRLTATKPLVTLAGTIFHPPHWRARGGASFENRTLTLSTFVNYIGGVLDNRTMVIRPVPSFTSVDTIARLRTGADHGALRGVSFDLAITNLFNEKPGPIINTNPADPPFDSTNYPSTGRVISLTLTKAW